MRELFDDQLDDVLDGVVDMVDRVRRATGDATQALLTADTQLAERVIAEDAEIDAGRESIETRSFLLLARQQPVAGDLRMLVAALRMVADLERMGDLAAHVAKLVRLRHPEHVVPRSAMPVIHEMAVVADRMVGDCRTVVTNRDVAAAEDLERADELMDRLRRSSFRIVLDREWEHGVEAAIDVALLGRYYERIADHAVSLARRVVYLVTGEHPVLAR